MNFWVRVIRRTFPRLSSKTLAACRRVSSGWSATNTAFPTAPRSSPLVGESYQVSWLERFQGSPVCARPSRLTISPASGEDFLESPIPCAGRQLIDVVRPIVQRRRIEVGALGPNEWVHLWINGDLIEQRQFRQGLERLARQYGP
jgi:hypothetical protein